MGLLALGRLVAGGHSHVWEVPSMQERSERITIADAAKRLRKPEPTVRVWASRYRARRLLKYGKTAWYDWNDLATIARCLHLGDPVPATPEARDELRASLRPAA
ncbi:hypothetical protein HS041_12240 [Planomonospora sp. ID67723]|uniref:hypothetical protein n=1 Tax=Planomonospora sp. ID67723 TaxID=2738134 RepID=UPI0018C43443|nr:hypothetical protein [Planomonospora sp. ID67723]MBG0828538.1 hypothetical protein [Planomonospora sp. ID67723]